MSVLRNFSGYVFDDAKVRLTVLIFAPRLCKSGAESKHGDLRSGIAYLAFRTLPRVLTAQRQSRSGVLLIASIRDISTKKNAEWYQP